MEQPDGVLLERWVAGRDAEAMAEIVARHSRMVYATCRRILGSGAEAADATQECFLRLATVQKAGPSLPGLLHTMATRLSLNQLRAERRRREREQRYVETLDPAQEARWDDVQGYVDEAIEGLEEKLRGPIVRHFLQGETHDAIAADLGLTRAGVSYRIDRGIREVRERLRRKGIAVAAPALAGMLASDVAEALPAELAESLGRAAIAGVQPRGAFAVGRMITGKGALSMRLVTAALIVVALSFGIWQSQRGEVEQPVRSAAADAQTPAVSPATPVAPAQEAAETAKGKGPVFADVRVLSDTGYPRPDVRLSRLWPLGDDEDKPETTDLEGHARLALKDGGKTQYLAMSQNTSRAALFTVLPEEPQVEVKLVCGIVEVSGRVVDDAGNPVPIAGVQLRLADGGGNAYELSPILTDKQGYYDWSEVPAADGYTLQARIMLPEGEPPLDWNEPLALSGRSYYAEIPDLKVSEAAAAKAANSKLFLEVGGCYRDTLLNDEGMERYGGVVKDTKGEPVRGACIELTYHPKTIGVMFVKRAVTDGAGRWSRLLPKGLGQVDIRLTHESHVATFNKNDFVKPSIQSMLAGNSVVVLEPGIPVTGTVRDEDGKPVGDALVYHALHSFTPGGPEPTANWPMEDVTSVRTDGAGSFALGSMAAGEGKLYLRKFGYAATEVPVELAAGMAPLSLTLERGGTVRGRILNQDGEPVAGAYLYSMEANVTGKADDDGNFVVEHVPRDKKLDLDFSAKGYYSSSIRDVVARDEPYDLILYRPLVFKGKVVDGKTGDPVTKFEVSQCWLLEDSDDWRILDMAGSEAVSSATGEFSWEFRRVSLVYPSKVQFAVTVAADGYYPARSPSVMLGDKMEPFTIRLETGASVAGVVLQPDGKPAAGAQVVCAKEGERHIVQRGQLWLAMVHDKRRFLETGADGSFKLLGDPEPMRLLAFHASGYAMFAADEFENGGQVRLTPWASVSGTVYKDGSPEQGALLVARSVAEGADELVQWEPERTGADGKFVFSHLPAMALEIGRGLCMTGKLEVSHGVHVDPSPGEQVEVEIGGGGWKVQGQLEVELPEALANEKNKAQLFRVVATPKDGQGTYLAEIDPDGRFAIHDVPAGAYQLSAGLYAPPPEGTYTEWTLVAGAEAAFDIEGADVELGVVALEERTE